MTWNAIDCPVVGNVVYANENSHNYYFKIRVANTRVPALSMQVQLQSGVWTATTKTQDNAFTVGLDGIVGLSINVRVTSIKGETFQDVIRFTSLSGTYQVWLFFLLSCVSV